jgi:hypothetical protein
MSKIISRSLIVLIFLFTALSVFWFFKTSSLKKQTLSLISSSGGSVSAASVSVSGFPLKQKLSISDLKIQSALLNPSSNITNALITNKYQIQIKNLEATTSILSGSFVIDKFEEITFQDQNGLVSSIQFNQSPKSSFLVSNGQLVNFSYQDTGYKVFDSAKNSLFENGPSTINFESSLKDDKYHNKLKAEFKDVGSLSVNESDSRKTAEIPAVASKDLSIVNPSSIAPTAAPVVNANQPNVDSVAEVKPTGDNLVKKSFLLDIEYVVSKSSSQDLVPVPNPESQNTATSDVAPASEKAIESMSIKNFEISSPLYKLNINGEIVSFPKDGLPVGSISVRIEKLDNVLTYIKKSLASIPSGSFNPSSTIIPAKLETNKSGDVVNEIAMKTSSVPTSTSDSSATPASNQKPEADIAMIIKNLSKKNVATNEEISVFDFRQEQGKDLLINETSLSEISSQIFINPVSPSPSAGVVNPNENKPDQGSKPLNAN